MDKTLAVSRDSLLSAFLALVFILSFIPYITEVTTATLMVGPITLIMLSTVILPIVSPARARYGFSALKRPRLLLLAFVVPALSTIVAITNGEWYAALYVILMIGVLCSVQVLLAVITLDKIIRAFTWAAVVCIWTFLVISSTEVLQAALSANRLIPASSQPNAIGFIFAGFVAVMTFSSLERQHATSTKIFYMVTAAAAAGTIFLASSRASMLALALAATGAVLLSVIHSLKTGRASKGLLCLIGLSIAAVTVGLLVFSSSSHERLIEYISNFLQINSSYRGVESGFSGRTIRWLITWNALAKGGTWLFGAGYRTSGADLGFSIDNGYLTLWYESGLVGLLFVISQMFWVLRLSVKRYFADSRLNRNLLPLMLFSVVIVLMVNNIFDRYLFGLGNPFSVLALFILLLNRQDMCKVTAPTGALALRSWI